MLVQEAVEIPEPYEAVIRTLASVEDEFQVWASAAYRRGEETAVGPASLVSAPIELEFGAPIPTMDGITIPMSWIATSATRLFPRMDAEVIVSPMQPAVTHLEFRGSYRPPLDGVGRLLDRLALHRIAESTVRNFLERLVTAMIAEIRAVESETGDETETTDVRQATRP